MTQTEAIRQVQPAIESHARQAGLDFFPVIYELVDYETMSTLAAYGGFPIRYPHWRFGMEYDQLAKGYRYGLQKIYEMVINTDPTYAYLLNVNDMTDHKLVMAHVCAHGDFFKNNYFFAPTNRKMIDEMANHARRIKKYIDLYGQETVEEFIDICLSLDNLIDIHSTAIKRKPDQEQINDTHAKRAAKLPGKKYLDGYINPPEKLEAEQLLLDEKFTQAKDPAGPFPRHPQRDVLAFLITHAPVADWQKDILAIIREEAYYFAPQAMTKIMNEGWATFWHSKLMTEKIIEPAEVIEYADHHSGTVASHPDQINPYRLGVMLFKDIVERWDKGQFGKDWEECDDMTAKKNWDKGLGQGMEKIFEVRMIHNDLTFIENFLTEDFCRKNNFFSFAYHRKNERYEIESREFKMIKKRLAQSLTNRGQPIIEVADANFDNQGKLILRHHYEGMELDRQYAEETLINLHSIWKRGVMIKTVVEGKKTYLSYD